MSTFILIAALYPLVLTGLCVGAGLAVDRLAAARLPTALLPVVGAAALMAVAQLVTDVPPLATWTPWVIAAVAVAGLFAGRRRVVTLARGESGTRWQVLMPVVVYALALAPVLCAGRPTFSGYRTLSDSAVHIAGADYLLHHGQSYAHLDLTNSYGQYIRDYYGTSYPSGGDTLFGGTALLLGLPLIWAFQPFVAFLLAIATGPAWLFARRFGLGGGWAAAATITACVPALVYGYELVGSVKEIAALACILGLGALAVVDSRWRNGPARAVIPLALLAAAGLSALGAAFAVWIVISAAVLAATVAADPRPGRRDLRRTAAITAMAGATVIVCAWPTWADVSGSVTVANDIATTGHLGNLASSLNLSQVFGTWLRANYLASPTGSDGLLTEVLIAVTLAAAVLGAAQSVRRRDWALVAWFGLSIGAWLGLTAYGGAWADAKLMMITSPMVMLLAWSGVRVLRESRLGPLAFALATALAAGVLGSDLMQYGGTTVAPTDRYEELASLDTRFAGRGPTLFTDFDEYSLYELRDLDVGGPDFLYPPTAVGALDVPHGRAVELDRATPAALRAYPLIITRVDPLSSRPPSVYRLLWSGTYYEVWGRRKAAPAALVHAAVAGGERSRCQAVQRVAAVAAAHGGFLLAASRPPIVSVDLAHARRPGTWVSTSYGLVIAAGRLGARVHVPRAGPWEVWLQGEFMSALRVTVDGRTAATVSGEVGASSIAPSNAAPIRVRLSAGEHTVELQRPATWLAPGDASSEILRAMFLTPARAGVRISRIAPTLARASCGRGLEWIEAVVA